MDAELVFGESMAIGTTAGTTVFTNVIDLGAIIDHKGASLQNRINLGDNMALNIVVEDADILAAVDGSVVTFRLYDDTDTVPTTGGRQLLEFAITANTPTEHPDGTQICSLPLPAMKVNRYLGMSVEIATQNLSTGKVTAWLGSVAQQS